MKRLHIAAAAGALLTAPAFAQGAIGTVERGAYVCELPGSADGKAGIEQPDRALTIQSASRYTYLRRGDTLTLTSGPREGERYAVVSPGFLRLIEDGKPGRLRCVRQG